MVKILQHKNRKVTDKNIAVPTQMIIKRQEIQEGDLSCGVKEKG